MANQKIEVASHKDIEALVGGLNGFSLGENFMDESGSCMKGGLETEGRKSLREPHGSSGQIYRFLSGDYIEDSHRYALVTEGGKVILSPRLRLGGVCYGRDILAFVQKYSRLKRHLKDAEVDYISEMDFENSIIEAARILSG